MEEGSTALVAAHLAKAEREAREGGFELPQRLMHAQDSRPKLIDISGGEVDPLVPADDNEPFALLDQTVRDIRGAHFVGKGDKELVQQMLAELEWIMKSAVDRALANGAQGSGMTVDPVILKTQRMSKRTQRMSTGEGAAAEEGDSVELISRGGLRIVRSVRKESANAQSSSGHAEDCPPGAHAHL